MIFVSLLTLSAERIQGVAPRRGIFCSMYVFSDTCVNGTQNHKATHESCVCLSVI